MAELSVWASEALAAARPAVFWSDRLPDPPTRPPLRGDVEADLAVVGGGFTGLWAALAAAERSPARQVVLLEAERVGFGASTRNGGFVDASLTHGLANGVRRWPEEIGELVRLGRANLDGLLADIDRLAIDCGLTASGELDVARTDWQVEELAESAELYDRHGIRADLLDRDGVQARLRSPRFLAGLHRPDDVVLVDPARLAQALRDAAEAAGVTIHEGSPVTAVEARGTGLALSTPAGRVHANRAVVATNAYTGPVGRTRRWIVPVYDHVLVTEPLDTEQRAAIGWAGREGAGDTAHRFHYYRLTDDDRVLWGGFEPTYHRGNGLDPAFDQDEPMHLRLARNFFDTFPQLEGLRFSHRWGGPIATTSSFTATWGTAHDGRVVWVGGYTGLGVGASRFGAATALDLVDGLATERTGLAMVRRKPVPFPPEPLRSLGIAVTQRAVRRADERGRSGWWLRLLDRLNMGFDF